MDLLPQLVGHVSVPQAVVDELEAGRALGYDLPDVNSLAWVSVRVPASQHVTSPELGHGETDALNLALELPEGEAVVLLDDARTREAAGRLGLTFTGTLGELLDAKRAGLLKSVTDAGRGQDRLRL